MKYDVLQKQYSIQSKELQTCDLMLNAKDSIIANQNSKLVNLNTIIYNKDQQIDNYNKMTGDLEKTLKKTQLQNKFLKASGSVVVLGLGALLILK